MWELFLTYIDLRPGVDREKCKCDRTKDTFRLFYYLDQLTKKIYTYNNQRVTLRDQEDENTRK